MNAAQLLVRCLENEGVRYVFGIPGEETLDLNAALEDSDNIQFVLTRHEQAAAFMADVYGRLSSFPGVCLATLGQGRRTCSPASPTRSSTARRSSPSPDKPGSNACTSSLISTSTWSRCSRR